MSARGFDQKQWRRIIFRSSTQSNPSTSEKMLRCGAAQYIIWFAVCALGVGLLGGDLYAQAQGTSQGSVHILEIRGVINPPVADYLQRALQDAAQQNAQLIVVELDTPGGLDTSMREMTQAILASPVPVAVYVTPPGARAASAGLFVLQASHIAVMAPSTNTGAAHPVDLSGQQVDETMTDKVVHDAAATIRSLADMRGRNAEWAERAVRESVSVTENEALELQVIDLVARDLDHLLEQVQGRTVETATGDVTLDVVGAPRYRAPMNLVEQLLHVISDPNIAFVLLSVGTIGIIAELYNPGLLFPGITGVISLILAFFALGNLPTNWAGVAFIILAIVLMVAELAVEGTGALGIGATIAFLFGGLLLFRPLSTPSPVMPDLRVDPWVLGSATTLMAAFIFLVIFQVARARLAPIRTGHEQYVDKVALVRTDLTPRGRVWFDSQFWYAEVRPAQKVPAGQTVRIVGIRRVDLDCRTDGRDTNRRDTNRRDTNRNDWSQTGHRRICVIVKLRRNSMENLGTIIVSLALLALFITIVALSIRIVPEYQRLVVFRLGRSLGARGPGLLFLIPFVDRGVRVDLREIFFDVEPQTCITKDNAPLSIDFLVYMRVIDSSLSVLEVKDFQGASRGIAITTLRALVGDMILDDVLAKRDQLNELLQGKLDQVTNRWGIKVTAVEIREIIPPREIQDAMSRQMSAERQRRAAVTEADGQREAVIIVAEGDKAARILQAEGQREAQVVEAEGQRQAEILRAEGFALALEQINAIAQTVESNTMSLQYLDTLKGLGQSAATKFVLPLEFTSLLQSITQHTRASGGNGAEK